jgi:hypothetical protein
MKLFPFVYLGLFLTRTRYRQMLFGVLVFGLVSVVSLAFVGPTIAFANHAIQQGLNFFRDVYMGHFISSVGGVDHSPLAFLKLIAAVMTHSLYAPYGTPELSRITHIMLKIYLPLTAIAGLVLYFLRIRKLPWLNQLLVLSIVSIYFTAFSGDGTLVHLYYAFALCCFLAMDASKKGRNIPGLRVMFLCFAYLFSVESFWIYHGLRFEGQAKCIVIGILLLVALFFPIGPLPSDENEMLLLVDQDSGQVPAIASRKTSGFANG